MLLRWNATADHDLSQFLDKAQELSRTLLGEYSCEGGPQCKGGSSAWPFYPTCNETTCAGLLQSLMPIRSTEAYSKSPDAGGVMIDVRGGTFDFESNGVEWRGNSERSDRGVGFQFPWESFASRFHRHTLNISSLWVQKYPVTNSQYAEYLHLTKFKPGDTEHWLEHWDPGPSMPAALANQPVRYVSLEDARAYCSHFGARLPHAWEWQWFAGGHERDGRLYP